MLRLNIVDPADRRNPNMLGVLGGDLAGFPNGRRVFDDVVTIELRAIAGRDEPAGRPSFTFDGAADAVTDGLTFDNYLPELPVPRRAVQRVRRTEQLMSGHVEEPIARPHPEHVVLEHRRRRRGADRSTPTRVGTISRSRSAPSGEEDGKREHQHILERPMPGRTMYAAVFCGLREGRYTLLTHDAVRERDVLVERCRT